MGLEFSQTFRRFGSRVTVLERGPRIMSREDDDVGEEATVAGEERSIPGSHLTGDAFFVFG